MKLIWMKLICACFLVACTDYSQNLENEYAYLRDGENIEECEDDDCDLSSSSSKSSSSKKSPSDGKNKSSSSIKEASSSSRSSSSGKNDDNRLSSEASDYTKTCQNVPYALKTAGPKNEYGDFGYVIPLKITNAKTQELYLTVKNCETGINGPKGWNTYSVLIAQYDAGKGQRVSGTEIFSKEVYDARPIAGGNFSTVAMCGFFEKFSFDIKGTWLEDSVGKTVDVVVNFYAPEELENRSSGIWYDYYSIPTTYGKYYDLYYSMSKMECSLQIEIPNQGIRNGCSVYKKEMDFVHYGDYYIGGKTLPYDGVEQGDTLIWNLPYLLTDKSWFSVESKYGKVVDVKTVKIDKDGNIVTGWEDYSSEYSFVYVVYPDAGAFNEALTFMVLPDEKMECSGLLFYKKDAKRGLVITDSILEVQSRSAKNCSCELSTENINESAQNGGSLLWTASGCQSDLSVKKYEWSGVTRKTDTTAAYEISNIKSNITPSVKITTENGGAVVVACPAVYVFNQIGLESSIDFPAGSHLVHFKLISKSNLSTHCSLRCSGGDNITVSFENESHLIRYTDAFDIPLSFCSTASFAEMSFSQDTKCYVDYY